MTQAQYDQCLEAWTEREATAEAMIPLIATASRIAAGKTVNATAILEPKILKSVCGIDFQNSMELLRLSEENASAK